MRYRLLCVNAVVLIALMGSLWGRHIESATVAHPDFLRPLSLPFHDWKPRDVEITKHDIAGTNAHPLKLNRNAEIDHSAAG